MTNITSNTVSRKAYLSGACTHSEYYGQFVTDRTLAYVASRIGKDRILASTDPHFNDIPLRLWDSITPKAPGSSLFEKAADYYTLAGGVCMLKEAARQIKEGVIA